MTRPSHSFSSITRIILVSKPQSSSISSLLHSPLTLSLRPKYPYQHPIFEKLQATFQFSGLVKYFVTWFLRWGDISTTTNHQAGWPPLVGRPRLLIQLFTATLHIWRPLLHSQTEDAPFRDDRET